MPLPRHLSLNLAREEPECFFVDQRVMQQYVKVLSIPPSSQIAQHPGSLQELAMTIPATFNINLVSPASTSTAALRGHGCLPHTKYSVHIAEA